MNSMQQAHLEANVQRGADLLDGLLPGVWFTVVDRQDLDMGDGNRCVAGQVVGWCNLTKMLPLASSLGVQDYGFLASTDRVMMVVLGRYDIPEQYNYLRDAWVRHIEKRLADAGLMV